MRTPKANELKQAAAQLLLRQQLLEEAAADRGLTHGERHTLLRRARSCAGVAQWLHMTAKASRRGKETDKC